MRVEERIAMVEGSLNSLNDAFSQHAANDRESFNEINKTVHAIDIGLERVSTTIKVTGIGVTAVIALLEFLLRYFM